MVQMFEEKKERTKKELDVKIAHLSILMTRRKPSRRMDVERRHEITFRRIQTWTLSSGRGRGGSGNNRDSTDLPTAKAADSAEPSDLTLSRTLRDKDTCVKNVNMLEEGGYKNWFYLLFYEVATFFLFLAATAALYLEVSD